MKTSLIKCIPALVLLSASCQSAFEYDCYHPAETELMKDIRHACNCFEAVDPYGDCSFDDWERINVLLLKIMNEPSDELMSEWNDMINDIN
ncbi:MAG: hypothetical protein MJZ34_13890 [Paludibacteraceae bacterium]|nr:hypothetical protein [Paludibacteraceae bacterium]